MKTKTITLLCLVFLLSGCTTLDQIKDQIKRPASTPTLMDFNQVILATEAVEESPTPVYTETPNYIDTQIAGQKEAAAQQIVAADKALDAARVNSENIDKQSTNIADEKTLTARKETHEANMANATTTQLVLVGTNDQAARDFQVALPTIVYAGTQAMYAGPKAQSEIGFNLMAGAAFLVIALVVLIAYLKSLKATPKATETHQATQAAKKTNVPVAKPTTLPFAPNSAGEYLSPPGNHHHFFIFLMLIFGGKKGFSKPEWETADSPYNRETYKPVYNWLFEHKFIELLPSIGLRFTTDGEGWAVGWMERNLLLSPDVDDPTYLQLSSGISQTPENQASEQGGGWAGEVVEPEEMEPMT